MKNVKDYIALLESEGAVNIVSGGDIDTVTPPIGGMAKRTPPELVDPPKVDTDGVTDDSADPKDKALFKSKQDQANQ